MRVKLLILLAVAASIMLSLVPVIQAQVAPTANRTSDIRATVLSVERLDFPNARLRLRVTESSRTSVLNVRSSAREITARNHLRTSQGRVDFANTDNIGAVGAYYLLQGDEIRGKLFSGSSTPGQTGEWSVYGIERVAGGSAAAPVRSTRMQGNLRLTLEMRQDTYAAGDPVRMTFTVENTGTQPETLHFSSGQQYDFIVTMAGTEVWRWSADRFFIQALTQFTLAPGAKRTFTETWFQKDNQGRQVKPGKYDIQAVLTTTGVRPTAGPVSVTVRSRE